MIEKYVDYALRLGFDEVAIKRSIIRRRQARFSNNEIDIFKNYFEDVCEVYLFKGKKMYHSVVNTMNIKEIIDEGIRIIDHAPENKLFEGLNPKKQSYNNKCIELENVEIDSVAKEAIEGALERGAKRASGVVYFTDELIDISTNYNTCRDRITDLHLVVRAFDENKNVGLWGAVTSRKNGFDPREVGEFAAHIALLSNRVEEGSEGKYDIVFSPLSLGTLLSYSVVFLSSYYVESQVSMFTDMVGKKVASENLTLYDDPTYMLRNGRLCDDEGTSTKKNVVIERGILKNYLHNYSSSIRMGMDNTANAGIMVPMPWIITLDPGKRSYEEMIQELQNGLFIINCWYTRFQNYRTGDFSTIPRDGVFFVKDGEIKSVWKNIRISDNMLRILRSVEEFSRERNEVCWWEEVMPSVLPYALIRDVNVTRAK